MVVLGKIPEKVEVPYFSISPAVSGVFRWAGTKTLVFTPSDPLSWNTTYRVTVAAGARAVSGSALETPHTFTFSTAPTRLAAASWYRKTGRFDSPVVLVLRFNQPVTAAAGDLPDLAGATVLLATHPGREGLELLPWESRIYEVG
jgi:hypothetical protein